MAKLQITENPFVAGLGKQPLNKQMTLLKAEESQPWEIDGESIPKFLFTLSDGTSFGVSHGQIRGSLVGNKPLPVIDNTVTIPDGVQFKIKTAKTDSGQRRYLQFSGELSSFK